MKFHVRPIKLTVLSLLITLLLIACSPTGSGGDVEPEAESMPDLDGTSWILEQFGPAGEATAVLPNTIITLNFADEGANGTAGCNSYFGEATQAGSALSFGALGSTKMACAESIMQQENAYLAALGSVSTFSLVDDRLTLQYDDGTLVFTAGTPEEANDEASANEASSSESRPENSTLRGITWMLVSFGPNDNQTAVLPNSEITLNFDGGQFNGSAGCNGYFVDVSLGDDDSLSLGLVASTVMACVNEDVMRQESDFLAALGEVTSYTLSGSRLTLHTADGSLEFVPATMHETQTEDVEMVDWETAVSILNSGEVVEIFQTHSLNVTLTLADGRTIQTVEPAIDDIFTAIEECGEPCSDIMMATE